MVERLVAESGVREGLVLVNAKADAIRRIAEGMAFPREHWIRIRTNNVLERIIREIRRRTWPTTERW